MVLHVSNDLSFNGHLTGFAFAYLDTLHLYTSFFLSNTDPLKVKQKASPPRVYMDRISVQYATHGIYRLYHILCTNSRGVQFFLAQNWFPKLKYQARSYGWHVFGHFCHCSVMEQATTRKVHIEN